MRKQLYYVLSLLTVILGSKQNPRPHPPAMENKMFKFEPLFSAEQEKLFSN